MVKLGVINATNGHELSEGLRNGVTQIAAHVATDMNNVHVFTAHLQMLQGGCEEAQIFVGRDVAQSQQIRSGRQTGGTRGCAVAGGLRQHARAWHDSDLA